MPQNTVLLLITIIMLVCGTVPVSVYQSLNRKILLVQRSASRLNIAQHSGLYFTTCIGPIGHSTQSTLF